MKIIGTLLILFFSYTLFSQEKDSIIDNEYIKIMDDKLSVKFDVNNDIETLNALENNIEFKLKPNIDYRTEVSVHYRFISFTVGVTPHLFTNFDKENKGETKILKLESDFYIKKWIQTVSYKQTKSFYSPDYPLPQDYPTDYLILDELKIYNIKGATRYRFNSNYSLKAITTQTEIQLKSAGTFIPGLVYSYNYIKNDETDQRLKTFNTTITVGYLHTFVISKKFYASIGLSPGVGIDFNKLEIVGNESSNTDTDLTLNFDGHLGLGYNYANWFGGGYFRLNTTNRKENDIVNYDNLRTHLQIFIGYRFNAPKFLKKEVDWIEEMSSF
tara:strand:+ start:2060 stop:3043 length:984 start_codon:yes stop_codon:yes gene_type:complete